MARVVDRADAGEAATAAVDSEVAVMVTVDPVGRMEEEVAAVAEPRDRRHTAVQSPDRRTLGWWSSRIARFDTTA